MPTIAQVLQKVVARLVAAGVEGAGRDARMILMHATGLSAARLSADMEATLDGPCLAAVEAAARRRAEREPMAHITGKKLFYKHEFLVTPDVLDPRPETEALIEAGLERPWRSLLDLGTGSGAILLSLLAERDGAKGTGTDVSPAALAVAEANARQLGLSDRCVMHVSNWYDRIAGSFDLIVSNPPYIALDEMEGLEPELSFEPRIALTDGADGLSAYRAICAGAPAHLTEGGWLMLEIGWQQGADVAALMTRAGLRDVSILPDLGGRDRVVIGQSGA